MLSWIQTTSNKEIPYTYGSIFLVSRLEGIIFETLNCKM